jgi:hypothetical protein
MYSVHYRRPLPVSFERALVHESSPQELGQTPLVDQIRFKISYSTIRRKIIKDEYKNLLEEYFKYEG